MAYVTTHYYVHAAITNYLLRIYVYLRSNSTECTSTTSRLGKSSHFWYIDCMIIDPLHRHHVYSGSTALYTISDIIIAMHRRIYKLPLAVLSTWGVVKVSTLGSLRAQAELGMRRKAHAAQPKHRPCQGSRSRLINFPNFKVTFIFFSLKITWNILIEIHSRHILSHIVT